MEILTLKPDRNLLDANFECYRLSLDPLPVLKQAVCGGVEDVQLQEDQYGYLHAQIFGRMNRLTLDPFAPESVFYISNTRNVQWSRLSQDGRFCPQRSVWVVPQSEIPGKLANSSISFAHAEWAVVCNGSSELFILNTTSRCEGEPWLQCHVHRIEENAEVGYPSVVLHSIYKTFPSHHQIECLSCHVSKSDEYPSFKNQNSKCHFACVLEWLTFSCAVGKENANGWFLKRHRRLLGFSAPTYAYFETLTSTLITVSEKPFQIAYDSDKQIITDLNPECDKGDREQLEPLYFFVQTKEDICVTFKVDTERRSDISIVIKSTNLRVRIKDKTVIDAPLSHPVDTTSSTWTFVDNRLEIFLTKASDIWWKALLLSGDDRGREVVDPALVEEAERLLAHLTSESEEVDVDRTPTAYDPQELEDCDLSTYENLILQRFDGDNHRITHQVNMGGYQWLFEATTGGANECLPNFCTRYDVDGVVWQPATVSKEDQVEKFQVDHVATFPALGYVLASKRDRKFVTSASNFGFAVVCDTNRHVYIYHQPENLESSSLRNRKTGREVDRVAKQHVISLDECQSILGLRANDRRVFILAQNCLYVIKVRESSD